MKFQVGCVAAIQTGVAPLQNIHLGSKTFEISNCKLFIAVQQISFWGVGVLKNLAGSYGNGTFIAIFTRAMY
jgi:hypothetical protein